MKNVKQFITTYAEAYLILITLLYGYSPPISVAPIYVGLIAMLAFQIIVKNKQTGIVIASLFFLINVGMLLAVISEFNEFLTANAKAIQLLFVGSLLFGFNLLLSALMLSKYLPKDDRATV